MVMTAIAADVNNYHYSFWIKLNHSIFKKRMILPHLLPLYKQPHQVCCCAQSLVPISGSFFAFLGVSFLAPVLYFFPDVFVLLLSAPSDLFGVTLLL